MSNRDKGDDTSDHQEAEGPGAEEGLGQSFIGVSTGKARQSRGNCVASASLNDSSRLWAV